MTGFHTEVPAHPFDIVLVNPTPKSVTASVVAYADTEGYLELVGSSRPALGGTGRTDTRLLKAGEPALFVLSSLRADAAYSYRFWSRPAVPGTGNAKKPESRPASSTPFTRPGPRGLLFPSPSLPTRTSTRT
jgi:hypothetical protein